MGRECVRVGRKMAGHTYIVADFMGVGGGARAGKWEKSNGRQLLSAALRCTEATLHS